jgi:tetratricopeptide (TPR) repeat protein
MAAGAVLGAWLISPCLAGQATNAATPGVGAEGPPLSAEVRQEIVALVEQLGANDAATRRQAKDKLKQMSQRASLILLQYTNAPDTEIRLSVMELLELDATAVDALLRQAEELWNQGKQAKGVGDAESARKKYKEAANLFAKTARDYPQHPLAPKAFLLAGQSRMQSEDWPAAVQCFESLLKTHPKATESIEANYWLGDCHTKMKDYASAARVFKKLVMDYPESKWAKYARGRLTENVFQNVETE